MKNWLTFTYRFSLSWQQYKLVTPDPEPNYLGTLALGRTLEYTYYTHGLLDVGAALFGE